jgi:hypothetical protein
VGAGGVVLLLLLLLDGLLVELFLQEILVTSITKQIIMIDRVIFFMGFVI